MGQSSYRNEVYAAFGIVAQCIVGDTSGRLDFVASTNHFNGLAGIFRSEVVEHDAVYATQVEYLLQFVEVTDFDFNLQVLAFFLTVFFGTE